MEFPSFPSFVTPWAAALLAAETDTPNKRKAEQDVEHEMFAFPVLSSRIAPSPKKLRLESTPTSPSSSPSSVEHSRRLKGVRQRKWGRWVAEIRDQRTKARVWLGSYEQGDEAARVYDMAARMIHGGSVHRSHLNFPEAAHPRPVTVPKSTAAALIKVVRANSGEQVGRSDDGELLGFQGDLVCLEVVGPQVVVTECPFTPLTFVAAPVVAAPASVAAAAVAETETTSETETAPDSLSLNQIDAFLKEDDDDSTCMWADVSPCCTGTSSFGSDQEAAFEAVRLWEKLLTA